MERGGFYCKHVSIGREIKEHTYKGSVDLESIHGH